MTCILSVCIFRNIENEVTTFSKDMNTANKSRSTKTPSLQDDGDKDGTRESHEKTYKFQTTGPDAIPKNIALTLDDRVTVELHFCKPEFKARLNFLVSVGNKYLKHWVYNTLNIRCISIYLAIILVSGEFVGEYQWQLAKLLTVADGSFFLPF